MMRLRPLAMLLAAVGSVQCAATTSSPMVIHLEDLPARPSLNVEWIRTHQAAAAVAMAVMQEELRFPRLQVALRIFDDRRAFEEGLLAVGYDADFARLTAQRMDAIGGHRQVLVNGAVLDRMDGVVRVALLAHELTHVFQYELGGGVRGTSAQWLREGLADWVAARVLAALYVQPFDDSRRTRIAQLRGGPSPPRLAHLATFQDWVALATPQGAGAMNAKAFLATDFLLERRGLPALLDYFGRFAASTDAPANFEAAFGEPLEAFEQALDAHLQRLR